MLTRSIPPWNAPKRVLVTTALLLSLILVAISAQPIVEALFAETFTATNIVATTSLHSQGTTTSDGLIEAKAQIQVDGPASTSANLRTCNGPPPGSVIGTVGSLCMDPVTTTLWQNTNGTTGWIPVNASAATSALYGTGADGALNFDGVNPVTIQGVSIAPVGSTYTIPTTIGSVVMGSNITIASGVTLTSAYTGLQVFATGTLSGAGVINMNGADATGNVAGGAKTTSASMFGGGSIPPNGATGCNNGAVGGVGTGGMPNMFRGIRPAGGAGHIGAGDNGVSAAGNPGFGGGGGGGGGNGTTITGLTGGASGVASFIGTGAEPPTSPGAFYTGHVSTSGAPSLWEPGFSGGGGASGTDGSVCSNGGGAGGNGNIVLVAARVCSLTAPIPITARGGSGGNGTDGTTLPGANGGGGGGGGGGAGGFVLVICGSGTPPSISVIGGAPGTGGVAKGGGGKGGDGGAGAAGLAFGLTL